MISLAPKDERYCMKYYQKVLIMIEASTVVYTLTK